MAIKLAIGADHRGYEHKTFLINAAELSHIVWHDVGADTPERSDYPVFAQRVVDLLKHNVVEGAVLLCGTGIGMAIAANRLRGIFAGVAWWEEVARRGREEDHINVLVIPADYVTKDVLISLVHAWQHAHPKDDRYAQRVMMIDKIA
jgi:ribose 5-phosphate isomerase B